MQYHFVTIGAPKCAFAKDGFYEYVKRLGRYHTVTLSHLPDNAPDKKILSTIGRHYCIALDEKGQSFTSRALADFLHTQSVNGMGKICFVVGGPDGHSDAVRARADVLWSLSELTLPHNMAMLVMAEALYRASTITAGHPYHRD